MPFPILFKLVLSFNSLWTQCPVIAHQRHCSCSPQICAPARGRASARQWEQANNKVLETPIRLQISKKKTKKKPQPHQNSSLCNNCHNLCPAGVSYPVEDDQFQQTAQHPCGLSTSWGCHSPKTTQINVWKWYLLSSSPWPLAKSAAALSNSANRISTKLNMSKY